MKKSVEMRVKSDVLEKLEVLVEDLSWTYNVRSHDENGDYRLMNENEVNADGTGWARENMEKYRYAVSLIEKVIEKLS